MLGNYDVAAGIGLGLVNESLSGLYDSYAIPHEVSFSAFLDQTKQQALVQELKANFRGIAQDPALGQFQISAAPTVNEVPTTPYVMVTVPFSLELAAGGTNTAALSGLLYFPAVCGASSPDGALVFALSAPSSLNPPADLPASSLRVKAASVVQPNSDQAANTIAALFGKLLAPFVMESLVVGPIVSIPKFSGSAGQTSTTVDVRTSAPRSGEINPVPAILAGVQFPGQNKPAVDPAALLDLGTSTAANLYVWVNSSTVHTAPYKARLNATQGKATIAQAPIHQTELLPTVSQLITTDTENGFAATVYVKLNPDLVSQFVYARFLGSVSGRFDAKPLQAASIQLCDLDAPAPAHDDTVIPKSGTTTHINGKFLETTTTTFQPPTTNQVLGRAKTNLDGRVIFAFEPGAGSFAGQVLVETVTREPGGPPVESSRRYGVTENLPDLFFTVDGTDVSGDTLKLPNGLFVNYAGKHLGSPAAPLTYTFTYGQHSIPILP